MRELSLIYAILLFSIFSYSQQTDIPTRFWKLTSLSGELNLNGSYWNQEINRNFSKERHENTLLSGGLFLKSKSYFWHPNFLSLDLNTGYSPETGQRLSLVTPDRNEVNTLKKLYVNASFFQQNSLNFNVYTNFNEGYNNRENLTNFRSNYENYGGNLYYTNKLLPISFSYNNGKAEQKEIDTERNYITKQNNFEGRATKSFGKNDKHEFTFSHNEYSHEDTFFTSPQTQNNSNILKNDINTLSLNSTVFFDSEKKYSLNSRISDIRQKGNIHYDRFQVFENIFLKLPKRFNFYGNYNYFNIQRVIQDSEQHTAAGTLSHQLYESLSTSAFYEYNTITSTQFDESIKRAGFDVKYNKKIPLDGRLSLTYRIKADIQDRESEAISLFIENEEQTISDGDIVLLNKQNVNGSTVIVRDITGTIIYQLNFDYVLIERNELLEIQRVPGGQIANNSPVLIDYMAIQPSSYQFEAINNYFGSSISLFNNLIEFYFNISKQTYIDPVNIDFLTLNYFDKNVYGSRFKIKFISGGIEHDNYRSNIIPYRSTRYYLAVHGDLKQKLFYTINGDLRDYHMIIEEGRRQKFYNVSGNVYYNFSPRTKLKLEAAYRKQEGEAIDLNLITSRLELTTSYRQLYVIAGLELYNRDFFNEQLDFRKVTIQLSRRF